VIMMPANVRRRRGLWLRWSWRDGRRRWVVIVVLGVIIGAGTGTYAALSSMSAWRRVSYDASYKLLNAHDLRVEVQGATVNAGRLAAVVDAVPIPELVTARAERLVVPTTVDASTAADAVMVEGQIIGAPIPNGTSVDVVHIDTGRALAPSDDDVVNGIMESKFAHFHGLGSAGTVRVAGGATINYVGLGVAPDQFVITGGEGDLQSEATFATVYTSLLTAQQLSGQPGRVNELVVRLTPAADVSMMRDALTKALAASLPDVAMSVTALVDEDTHRFLYRDIDTDQRFFNVFAVIIMAGVALAAFNLSNRIVEAQRREIGIGQALGMHPALLARRPLLIGVQIAVAAMIAGLGIGLLVNVALRRFLTDLLPLPVWRTAFQAELYARASMLAAALPLVASAYPVWRATRVAPIDALQSGALASRRGGFLRLLRRRRGRLLTVLPLRAVLRNPRRSLFTAVGIAASLTTVVAVLSMIDALRQTIAASERELYANRPDRVTVQLDQLYRADSSTVTGLTNLSSVALADTAVTMPVQVFGQAGRPPINVVAHSYHANNVWQPTVSQAVSTANDPGIIVTTAAAEDLGVRPGDYVSVRHLRRSGTGPMLTETTMVVAGLNPNPLRTFVYFDQRAVIAIGLGGMVNTLELLPENGTDALARDLFGRAGVAVVRPVGATTQMLRDWVGDFGEFLRIVEIIVVPLALLIAYNAASVAGEERAREQATMLAIGIRTRTIVATAMAESTLIGMVGTLVGLAGGWFALGWVIQVADETLPDIALRRTISPGTVMVAFVIGVIAVGLAPILLTRRVARINIAATIGTVD
jgi:putative ABC transport system permease protein